MEDGRTESSGGRKSRSPAGVQGSTGASLASCRPPQNENQRPRSRRHMGSRLWQLPPSSLQEYASWIREKPVTSQSPTEKRFLQQYHCRILIRKQKSPMETMKHYIARLEAKADLSDVELQLIQAYHRRKATKRARKRGDNPFRESAVAPAIFWKRESSLQKPLPSTTTIMSTIANLQESMNRMDLSSDRLLAIPMGEDFAKSPRDESTAHPS